MLLLAAALTILETVTLQGALHHVQGIDIEGETLWVSSVDKEARKGYLYKLEAKTGRIIVQVEVQDGERFHPGGITLDGDSIWVPVAEYRRTSSAQLQRRDKRTLKLLSSFAVSDHIGCVAASGDRLFGGNWDTKEIYEWDKFGVPIRKRSNETGTRFQDLKFVDGQLVGGGLREKGHGAVDWMDAETLAVTKRVHVETTDRGVVYTNEGMAVWGGTMYLLPEDGPSRLFKLKLP
jgi:glutamine cyclotransferase